MRTSGKRSTLNGTTGVVDATLVQHEAIAQRILLEVYKRILVDPAESQQDLAPQAAVTELESKKRASFNVCIQLAK